MSDKFSPQNQQISEEVDLGYLFRKISSFLKKSLIALYKIIAFFLNHKFIILGLIGIGIGLGYFKQSLSEPILNNRIIVIPNFESVDYLYDRVSALNAKIQTKDNKYLEAFIGEDYNRLRNIEIEHIDDLFTNVSDNNNKVELFKTLSQSKEADEFLNYYSITKTYKYHLLSIDLKGEGRSVEIVQSILDHFNDNSHFQDYAEIYREHNAFSIELNEQMLSQIDSLIAGHTKEKSQIERQTIDINQRNYLADLISKKQQIEQELLSLKKEKADFIHPIKLIKADYNIENQTLNKPIILYPILLVLIFCSFFLLKALYIKAKSIQ